MYAQTVKKVCRKELRYRECLKDADLSLGERERLYANTYAPHPRTVKVPSLSLFSPGANKPSSLVSLVDILIVTSSLGRLKRKWGCERFPRYFACRFNVD